MHSRLAIHQSPFASELEADLGVLGRVFADDSERDFAGPREVLLRCIVLAQRAGIFPKADVEHVEHPVKAIFDAPVRPYGFG